MSGYNWANCPPEVREQIDNVQQFLIRALGDNLIGIYIHGSLCLGCFQPAHSDLDLLIVAREPLLPKERFELMNGFLALHRQPIPLELSLLCITELKPWRHPAPFQFHFSEYWRERYEQIAAAQDLGFWDFPETYTDGDLACHVTLTNQSGIRLYGPAIPDVFPDVPEDDFWDSIAWGVEYYSKLDDDQLVTAILSLLRIWSYDAERVIYSKAGAGEWALDKVPPSYRYIVQNALDAYRAEDVMKTCPAEDLTALRMYVTDRIVRRTEA
jgi:predicted nucleotidyltransferase